MPILDIDTIKRNGKSFNSSRYVTNTQGKDFIFNRRCEINYKASMVFHTDTELIIEYEKGKILKRHFIIYQN